MKKDEVIVFGVVRQARTGLPSQNHLNLKQIHQPNYGTPDPQR